MGVPASQDALTTLTVKKGSSAASLSVVRYGDGSISFTSVNGRKQVCQRDQYAVKRLFDAINALV